MCSGLAGWGSSFCRSEATCTSTVRVWSTRRVAPDVLEQLAARDERAAVLDEVAEQLELQARELDRRAAARDLGAAEVHAHVAEGVGPGRRRRTRPPAPEHRLDAGQELHHVERLRQVVVRAELEPQHAVHHLAAGGEHEDRRLHALLAQVAQHVEAAPAGQGHVEQDDVEGAVAGEPQPLVAGLGRARPRSPRRAAGRSRVRTSVGSSSTTRTRGLTRLSSPRGAAGSSRTTAAPPPSRPSTRTRPPCARDHVADQAQAEAAAGNGVALRAPRPGRRARRPARARRAGIPGPRSSTRSTTARPVRPRRGAHRRATVRSRRTSPRSRRGCRGRGAARPRRPRTSAGPRAGRARRVIPACSSTRRWSRRTSSTRAATDSGSEA